MRLSKIASKRLIPGCYHLSLSRRKTSKETHHHHPKRGIKFKNKTTVLKREVKTSLPSELSLDRFLSKQFPLTQKHLPYGDTVCTFQRHVLKPPVKHCLTEQRVKAWLINSHYQQRVFRPERGPRVLPGCPWRPVDLRPQKRSCTCAFLGRSHVCPHRLVSSHTLTGML